MKNLKKYFATAALGILVPVLAHAQAANISATDLPITGYNVTGSPTSVIVSGTNYYPNDGKTLLVFKNNSGSAATATVTNQVSSVDVPGMGTITLSNNTIALPANSIVIAGPFPKNRWDTSYGTLAVSVSTPAVVSSSALKVK